MSKEKPEAGEVWLYNYERKYITRVTQITIFYINEHGDGVSHHTDDLTNWKYLGKAKTPLHKLFETE